MIIDVIKQFNWFDIIIIILLLRVCYIAMNTGFTVEIFKLFGTLIAAYIGLHYYTSVTDFIDSRFTVTILPLEFIDFLSLLSLTILSYLMFFLLRISFSKLVKIETVSTLNRWGGLVLGIFRGILLASLVTFLMLISSVSYIRESAVKSYLGITFFEIAPNFYNATYNGLISKFSPQEKSNEKNIEEIRKYFKE